MRRSKGRDFSRYDAVPRRGEGTRCAWSSSGMAGRSFLFLGDMDATCQWLEREKDGEVETGG